MYCYRPDFRPRSSAIWLNIARAGISQSFSSRRNGGTVITSYSIHYTKLYDVSVSLATLDASFLSELLSVFATFFVSSELSTLSAGRTFTTIDAEEVPFSFVAARETV